MKDQKEGLCGFSMKSLGEGRKGERAIFLGYRLQPKLNVKLLKGLK